MFENNKKMSWDSIKKVSTFQVVLVRFGLEEVVPFCLEEVVRFYLEEVVRFYLEEVAYVFVHILKVNKTITNHAVIT